MTRLLATLALAAAVAAQGTQAPPADDLSKGIQQVKDGSFEEGLLTLDGVVTRLGDSSDPKAVHDRAQAHLYLGVAYVGLLQETPARKHFKEALKLDKDLQLDTQQFPVRVVRVFEAARTGKSKSALYAKAGLGTAALIAGGAVLLASSGAVAVKSATEEIPTTTTPTTTTTTTPPVLPVLTRPGAFNVHTFTQSNAGTTLATVSAPAGADLGLSLCRGVATSTRDCNFAAAGGGGGTQTISASLPAGTNSLIVQAVTFPSGSTTISYTFTVRTP